MGSILLRRAHPIEKRVKVIIAITAVMAALLVLSIISALKTPQFAFFSFIIFMLWGGVFDYARKSWPRPKLIASFGIARSGRGYYPIVVRQHQFHTRKFFAEEWGELCCDPDEAVMNSKALIDNMQESLMSGDIKA